MTADFGAPLTMRQAEVLRLYVLGTKGVGAQAQRLGIHASSVVQHWRSIYSKLCVHNKEEAGQVAAREGDLILSKIELEKLKDTLSAPPPIDVEKEICRFIRDFWLAHNRNYATFTDVLVSFQLPQEDIMQILKALDRQCWIEIMQENGREVYRPLAVP